MMTSVVILAAALGMPSGERVPETKCGVAHYSFRVPTGYECKDRSSLLADFHLIEVVGKRRKTPFVTIYFGNHPSFPAYTWRRKPKEVDEAGRRTVRHAFDRAKGRMEGLLRYDGLRAPRGLPSPFTDIHYFAEGIDEDIAKQVEEIVNSINVTNKILPTPQESMGDRHHTKDRKDASPN